MCVSSEFRGPYAWRPRFDDKDTLDPFDKSSDLNLYRNKLENSFADEKEVDGNHAKDIINYAKDKETCDEEGEEKEEEDEDEEEEVDDGIDDSDVSEEEYESEIRRVFHNFSNPLERTHPWKRMSNMVNALRGETKWADYEETYRNDAEKFTIIDDCDMYGVSRECRPALSMHQMNDTLREQRYGTIGRVAHADIRRVYLPDITFKTVLCLADTLSDSRTRLLPDNRVLPEFIDRHLSAVPLVDTRFLSDGDEAFAFECHFPHFVLRKGRGLLEDQRRLPNHKPLRRFIDITSLRNVSDDTEGFDRDILYHAVTSLLVVGRHSSRWTAYLLTDSYFADRNKRDISEDSLEVWSNERMGKILASVKRKAPGTPDPFTLGNTQADKPLLNARDFFIDVMNARLVGAYQEQCMVVQHICERVNDHLDDNPALALARSKSFKEANANPTAPITGEKDMLERQNSLDWINENSAVIGEVVREISAVSKQLGHSEPVIQQMFCDGTSGRGGPIDRPDIRNGRASEWRYLKKRLDQSAERLSITQERLDDRMKRLEKALECARNTYHYTTTKIIKHATMAMFAIAPIALVAALFSTQAGFLPVSPSPDIFFGTMGVAEVMIWLLWYFRDQLHSHIGSFMIHKKEFQKG